MNEKEILRRTSRSFYLTLRLLPRTMREEASLGYLLARATDTLADASSLDTPRRLEALRSVRGSLGRADLRLDAADLEDGVVGRAAERALLDALPRLWREMHERNPVFRQRLRRCSAIFWKVRFSILRGSVTGPLRSVGRNSTSILTWWRAVLGSFGPICARKFLALFPASLLPR